MFAIIFNYIDVHKFASSSYKIPYFVLMQVQPDLKNCLLPYIIFFLFLMASGSLAAQNDKPNDTATDSIFAQAMARLNQPGGDTARYFMLQLVRKKCGNDYECLYQTYRSLQIKMEVAFKLPIALYLTDEIINISKREKSKENEAQALLDQYRYFNANGETHLSFISLDKAGRLFEQTGNIGRASYVRMAQLQSSLSYRKVEEVLKDLETLLKEAQSRKDQQSEIRLLITMIETSGDSSLTEDLEKYLVALEAIVAQQTGRQKYIIGKRATLGRAILSRLRQDPAEAIRQYQLTLQYLKQVPDLWVEVFTMQQLAELEWQQGNPTLAKQYLNQAEKEASDPNLFERLVKNYELKSRFAEEEGHAAEALDFLKKKFYYEQQWKNRGQGFDMRAYYLQQEKEQLSAETDRQELALELKEAQLRSRTVAIILATLLAGSLGVGFWFQRKKKKEAHRQKELIAQQAEKLKSLDAAKSRFFANVSHELRTPLTLVLGPIRTMLKNPQLSAEQSQFLEIADQGGKNLETLVNEILDLGKMEAGKMKLSLAPTRLVPFFNNYFSQFESLAQRNGVHYHFENQVDTHFKALIDREKCRQIVFNLLSNAFKFTQPGDSVTGILKMENGQLQLTVADTGKGIHPDDLAHVFDRYFQTDRPDAPATGGTGIGLAICQEYARLFGGSISVKSAPGIKTTFQLSFPVEEAIATEQVGEYENLYGESEEESNELLEAPAPIPAHRLGAQKPSVLVVEDNPELQNYLRLILQKDYHVMTAGNGIAALEAIQSDSPQSTVLEEGQTDDLKTDGSPRLLSGVDLIISDLMMPLMDGYQLLAKLKSEESTRQIPFIMLTARAGQDDRLKALRIGVDDYLTKPFDEEELKVRIENLLANHAVRKAAVAEMEPEKEATPIRSQEGEIWLREFEAFVRNNMSNNTLSVSWLAHEFAMSESTLLRQLKRLTGLNPQKFILEIRLNEARKLLEERQVDSVTRVASEVGYPDVRSFSRSFKSRFGKLPSEMLKD